MNTATHKMMMTIVFCMTLVMSITACSDNVNGSNEDSTGYSLPQKIAIIDAGSTGSRLKVYEIQTDSTIKKIYPTTEDEKTKSKGRALSTVANHTDSVKKYIEQMTTNYSHATSSETIPLYILATAGMRNQNKDMADDIYSKMASIQGDINGFKLQKAMTISGRYEGLYAWIAANYENKSLTTSSQGILEVGGASMQIAFATNSTAVPVDYKITRKDWGTLYCKSYLQGGIDAIYAQTPDTMPFKFTLPIEDISTYCSNTSFFGCSTGVIKILTGIEKAGSADAYAQTLPRTDRYHNFMCTYYLQWVIENLHLINRIIADPHDSDWAEGAAYDIIINKEMPEIFDYTKKL